MKIGMISLGCPKNLVDSEVMLGLAQQAGHQLTRDAADADVLVVNTCAFIDKAKQESIDTILEMAEHKKTGACQRLVVTGCMAERYRDELRAQIPEIDAVLGTGEVPEIVDAIGGSRASGTPALRDDLRSTASLRRSNGEPVEPRIPEPEARRPADLHLRRRHARACSRRRVTTPTSRSPKAATTSAPSASSRRCAATTAAVRPSRSSAKRERWPRAASRSCSSSRRTRRFYGIDRGERGALARLLRELNAVDGLEWIRMLYLYPTTIGDDVLDAMAESEKVCKYIDLPLQHASDAVLKRMKRPGTRAGYERLLERIRTRVPGVALRTTFIVGFPGETDGRLRASCRTSSRPSGSTTSASSPTRTRKARRPTACADDVPGADRSGSVRRALMTSAEADRRAQPSSRASGSSVRLLVDGPSAEHELVLARPARRPGARHRPGRLPDRLRPVGVRAGQFIEAEIVGPADGLRPGGPSSRPSP